MLICRGNISGGTFGTTFAGRFVSHLLHHETKCQRIMCWLSCTLLIRRLALLLDGIESTCANVHLPAWG